MHFAFATAESLCNLPLLFKTTIRDPFAQTILSRIASLGAIFYLVIDISMHWGVFRHLRHDVRANPAVLLTAIALDAVVLAASIWIKAQSDPMVLYFAVAGIGLIVIGERLFIHQKRIQQ